MVIHSLYIYDRKGSCLYYREWHRARSTLADTPGEERKLMFGLVSALKGLVKGLSPRPEDEGGVRSFRTKAYSLHHLETRTGVHFVLTADEGAGELRSELTHIYTSIFNRWVVRNPLHEPGRPIMSPEFDRELDERIARHPRFAV